MEIVVCTQNLEIILGLLVISLDATPFILYQLINRKMTLKYLIKM